jgi:hypothetical protein
MHRFKPITRRAHTVLHAQLAALVLATSVFAASGCGETSKANSAASTPQTSAPTTAAQTATQPSTTTTVPIQTVKVATGAPLSTTQWVSKGNAICAHLNAELSAQTIKNVSELVHVLPENAAYERSGANELMKLVPPKSKDGDWTTIVSAMLQISTDSTQIGHKAAEGLFNANSQLVIETTELHHRFDELARRDGLKACAIV